MWAALCAVAATQAGALVGDFIGFGVALLSIPLILIGAGGIMPVLIAACLGFAALIGAVHMFIGFRRPDMRPLAVRGVHFIGASAALFLCMRSLHHAF